MSAVLSRRTQDLLWYALFVVAIAVAYRFGMSFNKGGPSPFWFPDSVLLCTLLKARPRHWWIFFLTALPIRLGLQLPQGWPFWFTIDSFAIDAAKAIVSALLMRRYLANPIRFCTLKCFLFFVLVVVFAVPALAALVGAALRTTIGSPYWPSWEQWFMGDALTQLVVTPAILYWVFDPAWWRWKFDAGKVAEIAVLVVGLMVTGYLAANTEIGNFYTTMRFYSPVPFLIWAAIRFGVPGSSGSVLLVAIFAVEAAINGKGPFRGLSPGGTALTLQNFFLLRATLMTFIAISMEQRQAVEISLRESEERFRKMAHTAPVLIWMSGPDKLCNFFNQGWLDFTGRSLAQEMGNGWAEGVHPDDMKSCVEQYYAAFDLRQPFEIEYRLKRRDGVYRWILDRGVPRYGSGGAFAGYIGSALDITELKRAEDMSRALVHSQRLAVMGELTATIAHEMRQPMSAILLEAKTAQLMADAPTPKLDELREVLDHIRDNVLRVNAVIDRVRGFLRKQDAAPQAVDINDVVRDVTQLIRGDAVKRRIQIRTQLDGKAPPIRVDRGQIEQVLLNLAMNGMDAMEHHGRGARELKLDTRWSGDGMVEVTVKDCGQGIAPEHMPLLFESFFTTRKEGMGLGLSVAKSIIVTHGGSIWAENNEGGGAVFHFTVPVAEPSSRV
jgi:PAS domain S-box-containing protein